MTQGICQKRIWLIIEHSCPLSIRLGLREKTMQLILMLVEPNVIMLNMIMSKEPLPLRQKNY